LITAGHDFGPALETKLRDYSLAQAVAGTLRTVHHFAQLRASMRNIS